MLIDPIVDFHHIELRGLILAQQQLELVTAAAAARAERSSVGRRRRRNLRGFHG